MAILIEILERLLLRFGLAEKDEQLEKELNKFLPSILLKLNYPDEEVRKRVRKANILYLLTVHTIRVYP